MQDFDYWEPDSLAEAVTILSALKGQAFPLAGGTDLLPKLQKGQVSGSGVVNLKHVPELAGLGMERTSLRIGALTTVSSLLANKEVSTYFPALAGAARALGTPQIRNLATVGGNLCNASPAADLAVVLLAYEGRFKLAGPGGARTLAAQDFFIGPGQTALTQGEILTAVEIDIPPLHSRSAFLKHGLRKSHEIALVNAAVQLTLESGTDKIAATRIALGAVAPTPLRVRTAEAVLVGTRGGSAAWDEAAEKVMAAVAPIDDIRSTGAYRRHIAGVLTRRALHEAWGEAYETANHA